MYWFLWVSQFYKFEDKEYIKFPSHYNLRVVTLRLEREVRVCGNMPSMRERQICFGLLEFLKGRVCCLNNCKILPRRDEITEKLVLYLVIWILFCNQDWPLNLSTFPIKCSLPKTNYWVILFLSHISSVSFHLQGFLCLHEIFLFLHAKAI